MKIKSLFLPLNVILPLAANIKNPISVKLYEIQVKNPMQISYKVPANLFLSLGRALSNTSVPAKYDSGAHVRIRLYNIIIYLWDYNKIITPKVG